MLSIQLETYRMDFYTHFWWGEGYDDFLVPTVLYCTYISLDELRVMFCSIYKHSDFSEFEGAYWNPDAGWCDASAATAELMQAAVNRGVTYETGNVACLVLGPLVVQGVHLSDGRTLTADMVLLRAGVWTSYLMSTVEDHLQIDDSNRLEKQVIAAAVCVAH